SLSILLLALAAPVAAQTDYQDYKPPPDLEPLHRPYDQLLDEYNRDGVIYYNSLRADRGKLERYIAALNSPEVVSALPTWDKPRQIAFWINAYNAISLQTAVNHYPAG